MASQPPSHMHHHGPMHRGRRGRTPAWMHEQAARLTDNQRNALRVGGIVVVLLGLWMFSAPFRAFGDVGSGGFGFNPVEPFVGVLLFGLGSMMLRIGFLGVAAGIAATETEAGVQVAGAALGRGLRSGMGPGGQAEVVKVRCRACGYLESEDAKFCSQCRAAM